MTIFVLTSNFIFHTLGEEGKRERKRKTTTKNPQILFISCFLFCLSLSRKEHSGKKNFFSMMLEKKTLERK